MSGRKQSVKREWDSSLNISFASAKPNIESRKQQNKVNYNLFLEVSVFKPKTTRLLSR